MREITQLAEARDNEYGRKPPSRKQQDNAHDEASQPVQPRGRGFPVTTKTLAQRSHRSQDRLSGSRNSFRWELLDMGMETRITPNYLYRGCLS
jgi:hypothetical protein